MMAYVRDVFLSTSYPGTLLHRFSSFVLVFIQHAFRPVLNITHPTVTAISGSASQSSDLDYKQIHISFTVSWLISDVWRNGDQPSDGRRGSKT